MRPIVRRLHRPKGRKPVPGATIRARNARSLPMPNDTPAYVPNMSDTAVKAKTGKDWAGWFGALDKAGAAKLKHSQIAELLHETHDIPGWWCQMVTVEYELARGL